MLSPHVSRQHLWLHRPWELIRAISARLGGLYKDVRLNGSSVALVVLEDASREDLHISDLDVLYTVDFPYEDAHTYFGRILQVYSATINEHRLAIHQAVAGLYVFLLKKRFPARHDISGLLCNRFYP
jgi:hypothetical protein